MQKLAPTALVSLTLSWGLVWLWSVLQCPVQDSCLNSVRVSISLFPILCITGCEFKNQQIMFHTITTTRIRSKTECESSQGYVGEQKEKAYVDCGESSNTTEICSFASHVCSNSRKKIMTWERIMQRITFKSMFKDWYYTIEWVSL